MDEKLKLLYLITSIAIVATPVLAWIDSLIFGGQWTDWLLRCAFEMGAFIVGLWLGWVLFHSMPQSPKSDR